MPQTTQITDGTSALKIDFFDSIGIEVIPEVESYRSGLHGPTESP